MDSQLERCIQPYPLFYPGGIKRTAEAKEIHLEERKGIQSGAYQKLLFLCYRTKEILLRKIERNKWYHATRSGEYE